MGTQPVMDDPRWQELGGHMRELRQKENLKTYHIASPDSTESFVIPKEAYDAIADMLRKGQAGSVELHFHKGGIAGVESRRKWK